MAIARPPRRSNTVRRHFRRLETDAGNERMTQKHALQSPAGRRIRTAVAAVVVLLALGSCAAGSGASHHAASQGALYQFVLGIWHGLIAPVALAVEISNKRAPKLLPWRVHVY